MFLNKIKPFLYLGVFYLMVSLLLRVVFFFHPITTSDFSFMEIFNAIFGGILSDGLVFVLASSILVLYLLFLSNGKYDKPWGYIIFGGFILFFLYIWLIPNNIFQQYGGVVPEIAMYFVGMKMALFGLMFCLPKWRFSIRNILYFLTIFLYVIAVIFNVVSEYFFWNEFGVRYNFIAVDYLIYTNEVIGNIIESYPVIPLFSIILIVSLVVSIFIYIKTKDTLIKLPKFYQKLGLLGSFIGLFLLSLWLVPKLDTPKYDNIFANEIASNGLYKFYYAFTHSELDYFKFYKTLPEKTVEKAFLKTLGGKHLLRNINGRGEEVHKNVVLISVESLSAEFMEHYGDKEHTTPFLDSLAKKSLFFTNFYATGNRTVRGLEALTLCIPPTPGESVVKRKNNKEKFTTGSVFKSKGYQVKYLYGGDSYFDNMKDFFGGNEYDIVDRNSFKPEEITFANIWGVCDEDMAKKAIQIMNEEAKTGKPFFNHWMTVSNHRPFTYPNGKIDIPGDAKSRRGGVKYTDYSIKRFFELAKKENWYKNTVFVIVADHCASSSGKTELPLDKYRIPAMIFSEEFIEPQQFHGLMSQIDLMPTLFGLLNFNYQSKFLGYDVFSENYQPRAYVGTYQDLGLIKDNKLTIISPIKKTKQYDLYKEPSDIDDNFNIYYTEKPTYHINSKLEKECIEAYQSTSYWLKNNLLNR